MKYWFLWWALGIAAILTIQLLVIGPLCGKEVSALAGGISAAPWGFFIARRAFGRRKE